MAKKPRKPIFCICCADLAEIGQDKKGRPFLWCPRCGVRIFFTSPIGKLGYDLTAKVMTPLANTHRATISAIRSKMLAEADSE